MSFFTQTLGSVRRGETTKPIQVRSHSVLFSRRWNKTLVERVSKALLKEISPVQDGRIEFRKAMIVNHFISFFNTVEEMLSKQHLAGDHFHPKSGNQIFSDVPEDQYADDSVGRPIAHLSAEKHVTGEALYVDDIPKMAGEENLKLKL